MQSHTETVVCKPLTALPGDDGGGSDDEDTESESGSDRSDYSFTSDCLENDEIAGDALHAEHSAHSPRKLPEYVELWDNAHEMWEQRCLARYDMHTDTFYAEGDWRMPVSLKGKIVKRAHAEPCAAARALHQKGAKACPCLVSIYDIPVLLMSYKAKADCFKAIVFGANRGRIKQSALRLYYHAGVRMFSPATRLSLTGAVHFERRCELSGMGKQWRAIVRNQT